MVSSVIIAAITGFLWTTLSAFWGWIIAGGLAILGFLFSPTLRKYTIAVITVAAVLGSAYVYGYSKGATAPRDPVPPACSEFRKVLVTGPATDKAIAIFQRKGLCV